MTARLLAASLLPLALTSVSITVLYIVALDVLQIAREQFGEKGRG